MANQYGVTGRIASWGQGDIGSSTRRLIFRRRPTHRCSTLSFWLKSSWNLPSHQWRLLSRSLTVCRKSIDANRIWPGRKWESAFCSTPRALLFIASNLNLNSPGVKKPETWDLWSKCPLLLETCPVQSIAKREVRKNDNPCPTKCHKLRDRRAAAWVGALKGQRVGVWRK